MGLCIGGGDAASRDPLGAKPNPFYCEATPGRLTGVAVPVDVGRRTIVLQTTIYRADGKLAAMMIQTQMVFPRGLAIPADGGGGEAWCPYPVLLD
jgi:hypothetical protein